MQAPGQRGCSFPERTIVSHVGNIMNKPGFSSRAQIAGWMMAPDP